MGAGCNDLAFHQQDHLVKRAGRCNFLSYGYQCDAGIIVPQLSSIFLRTGVHPRSEIIEQQYPRICARARASMILCFCPPLRLVPLSDTMVSSFPAAMR
jgi:hypothetical protein